MFVCGKNATLWAGLRGVIRSIQGVQAVEITIANSRRDVANTVALSRARVEMEVSTNANSTNERRGQTSRVDYRPEARFPRTNRGCIQDALRDPLRLEKNATFR
jgi:hypothetical protein